MKTHTIIKHTATLLSAAVLLALPARAVQNFNKTHSYTTGDSRFGAVASFYASDDYIAPSGPGTGSYSVTAGGSVTGKILSGSVTALSGNGTVKVKTDGKGTFSGTLKALGFSLVNVSNKALPYSSSHYVKEWSASTTIPFTLFLIPCDVKAKVTASVDAWFRVDTSSSSIATFGGIPRMEIKMGPVADLAATGTASAGAGFAGIASVRMGVTGSLRLGKVALTATANVNPVVPVITTATFQSTTPTFATISPVATMTLVSAGPPAKATVTVSLTLSTSGLNGSLDAWVRGELWPFGSASKTKNIISYSSGPASVNLLGPVTYRWF